MNIIDAEFTLLVTSVVIVITENLVYLVPDQQVSIEEELKLEHTLLTCWPSKL